MYGLSGQNEDLVIEKAAGTQRKGGCRGPGAGVDISRKGIDVFVCNFTFLLSPFYSAEAIQMCKKKLPLKLRNREETTGLV